MQARPSHEFVEHIGLAVPNSELGRRVFKRHH